MPYRAPGAYARFVKTAGPISNAGNSRYMALVGTGVNYYEVYNEPVDRNDSRTYDILDNSNVFEIIAVTARPYRRGAKDPNNTVYSQGIIQGNSFDLKDGKYIAWATLPSNPPSIVIRATSSDGSFAIRDAIVDAGDALIDPNFDYLVEDEKWKVEITYIDDDQTGDDRGAYRVTRVSTGEVVGEYGCSTKEQTGVIPGVEFTMPKSYVIDPVSGENRVKVGDYVIIETMAGKTEIESKVSFDTTVANHSAELQSLISNLMIVNNENVVTNSYTLMVINPSTKSIQINQVGVTEPLFLGPVTSVDEYLEIIPGITFILTDIPSTAVAGDTVQINTVARVAGVAPAEQDTYYVSYKYRKSSASYDPQIFFDYDDVVAEYGNYDVTASSVVINSLALGAEIAFNSGITPVICVQAKNDSDYEMKLAIDKLKRTLPGVRNVNTIIPLTSSPAVQAYLSEHVSLMSSEEMGKERMGYTGAYIGQPITKTPTALDKTIGMVETADALDEERIVYVVPGEAYKEVRDLNTGKVNMRLLPACYLSVAVASLGLFNDPAEPLTNKKITGFSGLKTMYMDSEKNFLSSRGCCVLEQRGSSIYVRHGLTTCNDDVNTSEITLIQIKDYVIDACRQACGESYIGLKNKPSILADIQYTITSILNQFISQEVILGYQGLKVKRDPNDPTQVNVNFEIEAVYPLNYIVITFGFAAYNG